MTLSRVKEQTAQKIFKIQTCSKLIIRISKQRWQCSFTLQTIASEQPVCDATNLIYTMCFEHLQTCLEHICGSAASEMTISPF